VAAYAGTNAYKLKKGFKEIFHNSVMGFFNEQRLELAFQLLAE
jgi:AraC-like DNA-binding protein